MDIGAQAHQYEQQLAAKEQEIADLKRELEEAQISKLAAKQAYDAAVETSIRHCSRAEAAEARLSALISAAEPLMNWPAQNFGGKSYRTIPADLFNKFVAAVEKAKAMT